MGQVETIDVALPHPLLPGSDWADAYCANMRDHYPDAKSAADAVLKALPRWITPALALRQMLVAPFGLKGVAEAPSASGQRLGIFPIVSQEPDEIVLGFNDTHLDFRLIGHLKPTDALQTFTLTTVIRRHNLLGRLYLALVTPFHIVLIKTALKRLAA